MHTKLTSFQTELIKIAARKSNVKKSLGMIELSNMEITKRLLETKKKTVESWAEVFLKLDNESSKVTPKLPIHSSHFRTYVFFKYMAKCRLLRF